MIFTPGKFYVDLVSEITYLCVYAYDHLELIDCVYWNDEENEFVLVELESQGFKLKEKQEWDE